MFFFTVFLFAWRVVRGLVKIAKRLADCFRLPCRAVRPPLVVHKVRRTVRLYRPQVAFGGRWHCSPAFVIGKIIQTVAKKSRSLSLNCKKCSAIKNFHAKMLCNGVFLIALLCILIYNRICVKVGELSLLVKIRLRREL